ncbi:hypothetical protein Q3G72_011150 [Acer saccharum]|nr:hypothetical protein Q3G72_011150 [Acer saccharum]
MEHRDRDRSTLHQRCRNPLLELIHCQVCSKMMAARMMLEDDEDDEVCSKMMAARMMLEDDEDDEVC